MNIDCWKFQSLVTDSQFMKSSVSHATKIQSLEFISTAQIAKTLNYVIFHNILGQKCYFERPKTDSNSRNHKPDHQMEVIFEPQINEEKKYECFACKV